MFFIEDGTAIKVGDIVMEVRGKAQSILSTERLVLNIMQRMSGIATKNPSHSFTNQTYPSKGPRHAKKTTPGIRILEKNGGCYRGRDEPPIWFI